MQKYEKIMKFTFMNNESVLDIGESEVQRFRKYYLINKGFHDHKSVKIGNISREFIKKTKKKNLIASRKMNKKL